MPPESDGCQAATSFLSDCSSHAVLHFECCQIVQYLSLPPCLIIHPVQVLDVNAAWQHITYAGSRVRVRVRMTVRVRINLAQTRLTSVSCPPDPVRGLERPRWSARRRHGRLHVDARRACEPPPRDVFPQDHHLRSGTSYFYMLPVMERRHDRSSCAHFASDCYLVLLVHCRRDLCFRFALTPLLPVCAG